MKLSDGTELEITHSNMYVGGVSNCSSLYEVKLLLTKEGSSAQTLQCVIHYWGYGSCGVTMLERFSTTLILADRYSHLAKEVWGALYNYLLGMNTYSQAGQITFATTNGYFSRPAQFGHWLVYTPPEGTITKQTHKYHNQAHCDPNNPTTGTVVYVFWHHKKPGSLP